MANLSTPYHACSLVYLSGSTCPYAAYRRFHGHWFCVRHLRQANLDRTKSKDNQR